MPQNITLTAEDLVKQAKAEITEYTVDEVKAKAGEENVVLVDIRDPRELTREGKMPGAFHCPRGMLEFWISPESPYHKDVFAQDKEFVERFLREARAAANLDHPGIVTIYDVGEEDGTYFFSSPFSSGSFRVIQVLEGGGS